ncbi:MAG: GDSL-type esterase/lipase family protein [Parcubacteria group bacterium]
MSSEKSISNKIKTICVFGDSTAWGAWDTEKGGWVNRLWLHMANKPDGDSGYADIYNCSVSGGTTETILDRFESETKIREADAIIFQSGGNDSCFLGKDGPNEVSFDKFKENIREIIKRAKKITDKIIFVTFKNVDESRTIPVSWGEYYYLNSELEKYNTVIMEVCRENGLSYLDIFGSLENDDFEDGLHPNTSGHEKLFLKVKEFLEEKKWI